MPPEMMRLAPYAQFLAIWVGHGGSCLDHGAFGKNATIPAQRVRHLSAKL